MAEVKKETAKRTTRAKRTTKARAKTPRTKMNLFAKKKFGGSVVKKSKGTSIALPIDLDADGKLQGDSAELNEAIHEVIEASRDANSAKNRAGIAKGVLGRFVHSAFANEYAKAGVLPSTPVVFVNHNGESLTYVVQDKTQQNGLDENQVELLGELFGDNAVSDMVEEITVFSFNSRTMGELASDGTLISDVVTEIVSEAIGSDGRLTDEQKELLICQSSKVLLKRGILQRLAEFTGSDSMKILQALDAIGSGCVRYLKS